MAGFLDKNTRVMDMILTLEGKRLMSTNQLDFAYFALFDDEVDYDPYIAQSGSMTDTEVSGMKLDLTETSLIREAVSGYLYGINGDSFDFTNVKNKLFTMKQGSKVIPTFTLQSGPSGSTELSMRQQKVQNVSVRTEGDVTSAVVSQDAGYKRFGSQGIDILYNLTPEAMAADISQQDGILIRVFASGSDEPIEIKEKRDSTNRICYNSDLVVEIKRNE